MPVRPDTPRTRSLWLNSPSNPTGWTATRAELQQVLDLAREKGLWIIADEIYGRLIYDGEFHSIASEPGMQERTIIADGLSKT